MPARRLPPLRALEAFMRTVRLGSARAAAEEIGLIPQDHQSRRIRRQKTVYAGAAIDAAD